MAVISKSLNLPGDSACLEMGEKRGRQTLKGKLMGDISKAMLQEGHGGAHSGSYLSGNCGEGARETGLKGVTPDLKGL